ncbi:MAG: amino acid hydroxylase [Anaerolineae bacterium]|nr:amino acid hydroxylase [Anaerolineae bacterium]
MTDQIVLTTLTYSDEDHGTWSELYRRQWDRVQNIACQQWIAGMAKLALDPTRVPVAAEISARIEGMTGWTLGDAQNAYLGRTEWFEHLAERRFPVTNYIRRPHEIEFTPLPDLFHEYFGHLAFFTDQWFADTAEMFGKLYLATTDERQQVEIARLWWFTTEFGLIREAGEIKLYGAGLLSSPGELNFALLPETPRYQFDIRQVAQTESAVHSYHKGYFVLEDADQVRRILRDYARMEGLPDVTK